jgi:hypothetical protein
VSSREASRPIDEGGREGVGRGVIRPGGFAYPGRQKGDELTAAPRSDGFGSVEGSPFVLSRHRSARLNLDVKKGHYAERRDGVGRRA